MKSVHYLKTFTKCTVKNIVPPPVTKIESDEI